MGNERLFLARTKIIKFYKCYEKWLVSVAKYLSVVWLLAMITNQIGYVEILSKSSTILGIAFVSMFLPIQYITFLVMGVIGIHLIGLNLIVGGICIGVFIILYFMYIRLYPKESLLILITMIAFSLKCEYIVPIIAALFGGYAGSVAIAVGVIGVYSSEVIQLIIQSNSIPLEMTVMIQQITDLMVNNVLFNRNMLGTIVIFWCVFSIIYFIRKQSVDYAPYIGVIVGAVMNLLGFGLAVLFLKVEVNVGMLFGMTVLGAIIAVVVQFLAQPLDYSRVEIVQFEDEQNVYYVKVVPKIAIHAKPQKVEQIYTMNTQVEKEIL